MMKTNLNVSPYYDDFDEKKNFHRILFRPGYSVQARELTQLQTILQNQIERFGNHVFKHGSVVIPGNTAADLSVDYAKLQQVDGFSFGTNLFKENDIIVGATNGVRAIVRAYVSADLEGPATVYFAYTSGGVDSTGEPNGVNQFFAGEEIFSLQVAGVRAAVQTTPGSIGLGSLAQVGAGVYYVNGHFVAVDSQTIVIDRYGQQPTCRVVLKITESIITVDEDNSLLDPSQGSYNYAAPGADRFAVDLKLEKYSYFDATTDDYVELMRYNTGVLEEHSRFAKYSELDKSLAKRTFEESGNYRVSGFNVTAREHLRTLASNGVAPNGGLYANGDRDKFVLTVSPGRSYINGFAVERTGPSNIVLDKARTAATTLQRKDVSLRPKLGQYIYISDVSGGLINFNQQPQLNLYANSANTGQAIGTCKTTNVDFAYGSGQTKVYLLGIQRLQLNQGYTVADIGGFSVNGSTAIGKVCHKLEISNPLLDFIPGDTVTYTPTSGVRQATVEVFDRGSLSVYVYRSGLAKIPVRGDFITATGGATATVRSVQSLNGSDNTTLLVQLPYANTRSVKNSVNQTENIYYTWTYARLSTDSSGTGSVSLNTGESIVAIEDGTFLALASTGFLSNSLFSLNDNGGTVTVTGGPVNSDIGISCVVKKQNSKERVKTLTTAVPYNSIVSKNQATITLPHSDIYTVGKVTLDPDGSAVDVTASCQISNGATDIEYGNGTVTYLNSFETGQTLRVEYSYFEHSTSGDYFSIDSYVDTFGPEVYEKVNQYVSSSGTRFNLTDCLDFRKSGSSVVVPVSNYTFSTSIQSFIGYYTLVYLDASGVKNSVGAAADKPLIPKLPVDMLAIATVYVPAYTQNAGLVIIQEEKNYTYTMSDISRLERRVENLEYFSTLTSEESQAAKYNVIDAATGLNRFKTGLIVEKFADQGVSSNLFERQNTVSFLEQGITAAVTSDKNTLSVLPNNAARGSYNTKFVNDNAVCIDYSEVEWAQCAISSTVENLNPFMVFKWTGVLKITPDFDSFIETINLPEVFNNLSLTNTVNLPGTGGVIPVGPGTNPIAPTGKTAQTIAFTVSTTKETGTTEVLSATSSSGLPVAWSTSTPGICSLVDNTLTMLSAGRCTVSAHQVGDTTFAPAPSVVRSITVTGKTNVITFTLPSTLSRLVGTHTLTAVASSALPVAYYTSTPGVCTISGSILSLVGSGNCIVTASQAGNGEYPLAVSITRTVMVTALPANIISFYPNKTENQTSLTVDMGTPTTLFASASSALPVTLVSLTPDVCAVSGNTLTGIVAPDSGTNACLISANQSGSAQFAPAVSVVRRFDIRRRQQIINFTTPDSNKVIGSTATTLVASSTSGLPVAFESTTTAICSVTGNQLIALAPGVCSIAARQDGNGTISAAPIVIKKINVTAFVKTVQNLVFTNPGAVVVGQTKTLVATASSGTPVIFTSSTPTSCTVSGSTLTAVSLGNCVITASNTGNDVFREVSVIQQFGIVSVAAAPVTLAVVSISGSSQIGEYRLMRATSTASLVPITTLSTTPGVCSISNEVTTGSYTEFRVNYTAAGSCVISSKETGTDAIPVLTTFNVPAISNKILQSIALSINENTNLALQNQGEVGVPQSWRAVPSNSTIPVVFSTNVTGACTVTPIPGRPNNVTLNFLTTGLCQLIARQAGNSVYEPGEAIYSTTVIPAGSSGPAVSGDNITFRNLSASYYSNLLPIVYASDSANSVVELISATPLVCTINSNNTPRIEGGVHIYEGSVVFGGTYGTCTIVGSANRSGVVSKQVSFNVLVPGAVTANPVSLPYVIPSSFTLDGDNFTVDQVKTLTPVLANSTTGQPNDIIICRTNTPNVCTFVDENNFSNLLSLKYSGSSVLLKFKSAGTCNITAAPNMYPAGISAPIVLLSKTIGDKPPITFSLTSTEQDQDSVVGVKTGINIITNMPNPDRDIEIKSETTGVCTVTRIGPAVGSFGGSWEIDLVGVGSCNVTARNININYHNFNYAHPPFPVSLKIAQTLTVS